MLPITADAERWIRLVRKLPREVRIERRELFLASYEEWFGKTYPKDLREEQLPD